MQDNLKAKSRTAGNANKSVTSISSVGMLVLACLAALVLLRTSMANADRTTVVIRVDDMQDFAFRDAQIFLLNESMDNGVPLSLAVIAGMFGEDREIVQTVRLAIDSGSEIAAHGWKHEDFGPLPFEEQASLLSQSRTRLRDVLGYDVRVFVPPMFGFSYDTLSALTREGYEVISTFADLAPPGPISNVMNIPATVELSDYSNGAWQMKSIDSVTAEVSKSIQRAGFAVIVTHPQEFITGERLDEVKAESFRDLLRKLKSAYSVQSLARLAVDHRDLLSTLPAVAGGR